MYKALVVDDEPLILDGFDHIIRWEEFGVEICAKACNGYEALELMAVMDVDILVTDIKMPDMDGLELLRNIRKLGISVKTIILSGYDDFQFVKEASRYGIENYLLKPIEEMELSDTLLNIVDKLDREKQAQVRMQEGNSLLRQNILCRWVSNEIGDEELRNRAGFLGISLDADYYLSCIIRVKRGDPSGQRGGGVNAADSLKAVQDICLGLFSNYNGYLNFITVNGDFCILFTWKGTQCDPAGIALELGRCPAMLKEATGEDVFITIGSVEQGYQQAHRSFRNACRLLDYQMVMQNEAIVSYNAVEKNLAETKSELKIDFELFRNRLAAKDIDSATGFIDGIYARLYDVNVVSPEYIRNLTLEFMFHISSVFNGESNSTIFRNIFSDELFDKLLHALNVSDIAFQLKACIRENIDRNESLYQDANPVIIAVLNFVESNYAQEISLKTLSNKYRINAAYLGQLFKGATGELFSNYLNRVRVEQAKQLLSGTNQKTSDIAAKVGFANVNYFSNLFKKITGVYPTEYRKST